jgi:hypothetical protein
MRNTKQNNSQPSSLIPLILAISLAFLAIITSILSIIHNSNESSNFLIPIILTISSLLIAIFTLGRKPIHSAINEISPLFSFIRKSRFFAIFAIFGRIINVLVILLVLLIVLGIGSLIFGYISHNSPIIVIGIIIIVLSLLLSSASYKVLREKIEQIPSTSAYPNVSIKRATENEGFVIQRQVITYEYLSDGITMIQRKFLQAQALRSGLTHFTQKYRWTGSGKCTIRVLTPGFKIVNEREEGIAPWDFFDIEFPHTLKKNEQVNFEIEWELVDEKNSFVPFLSYTTDVETKYLLLEVIFPENLAPKRAYSYEFTNYMDILPIETNEIHWSKETKRLHYEITHPKKYHRYLIRWYND